MIDRSRIDLDAALAALERDERAVRPAPSTALASRVLEDAAEIAAGFARARPKTSTLAVKVRASGRWRQFFRFADAWAGAAVAAVLLFLVLGFGVGYEAGPEVMAEVGFGDQETALADAGDGLFAIGDAI